MLAVARMGGGAGGPDGVFGGVCDVTYFGVEEIIGAGVRSVGSAVLGETPDRGARTDISVVADSGAIGWGDRVGGGVDGNGGWNFFDAVDAGTKLGENEDGFGGFGGIHFSKFDCGIAGELAIGGGASGDDGRITVSGDGGRGDRILLGGLAVVGFGD